MDEAGRPLPAVEPTPGEDVPVPGGDADGEPRDPGAAEPQALESEAPESEAAEAPARPRSRLRRVIAAVRRVVHLPRTRRGWSALLLVTGALAIVAIAGAVQVIAWTETADFCGRCHTMGPELAAHAAGPHADVSCGECHVAPGLDGWVTAKINGTRQLIEIVLGTFPEPIPPPEHEALPPTSETCVKCHSLPNLGTTRLVTRVQYTTDEANTRQFVALMIRPRNGDFLDVNQGVHWHVLQDVEFISAQANAQKIDYIKVTTSTGEVKEFVSEGAIRIADDVAPDLAILKAAGEERRMDCRDCHNRIGHALPSPRKVIDQALSDGRVDATLPYIKREAMSVLYGGYGTNVDADTAAEAIRGFYLAKYPILAREKASEIDAAIGEIKVLFRLAATPAMRVTAKTYPDNLGHMDFIGCFRCHDGAHFLIKDGGLTNQAIPSSCDTCHTFPQIGQAIANLPLGIPPTTHGDRLWVFDHRTAITETDPGKTSCGECHARDYCLNCHKTGAVTVDHDEMLTNHARVIRRQGVEACNYCHQPVYCARCHADDPVLDVAPPPTGSGTGLAEPPSGISWPLLTLGLPPPST